LRGWARGERKAAPAAFIDPGQRRRRDPLTCSIPTLALLLHGRELGRIAGAVSAGQLVRWAESRAAA
jgi:hypothetical protein